VIGLPKLPKISCLLVTADGRLETFRRSYQCYLDQTYPNRELVIVNEGPASYQNEISQIVDGRPDVKKHFFLVKKGDYTLGGLRNISVALCTGDLWMQWDDDDFNAPERIATQYSFLAKNKQASVCFLGDQLHYYYSNNHLYWDNWKWYDGGNQDKYSLIPGTIMAYKKGFQYKYPSSGSFARAAEDSVLTNQYSDEKPNEIVILSEFGYLHIYSFHGTNVWDEEHHLQISKRRSVCVDYMIKNRDRICRTLKYMKFPGEVQVMGREGLAFVWERDT
jgi:glycosyltransferase involved in cell wall biosynthesis